MPQSGAFCVLVAAGLALTAIPVPGHGDDTPLFTPRLDWENQPSGDRTFTNAIISIPEMDDFRCKIWCYEMGPQGEGTGELLEDGALVLSHDFDGAAVSTRLTPEPGAVEFEVTVTGDDPAKVRAVKGVNACWQLRESDGFGNRGHFFEDFVSRCFIYTIRGLTLMGETNRFPDTRADRYQEDDERNNPPWVQVYVPVWRRHTGQPKAFWGYSTDRPIYSLIGCVSRDGRWLAAWGWPLSSALSQGWHDCLHAGPSFAGCYDEATNTTRCTGKLYFMPNDPDAFLTRYLADFPQDEPAITVSVTEDNRLSLAHRDRPDAPVLLRDQIPNWKTKPWGALHSLVEVEGAQASYWVRPYGEFVDICATVRNTGEAELPLGRTLPLQESPDGPWQPVEIAEDRVLLGTADGWSAGMAQEMPAEVLAPGAECTVRARVRMAHCSAEALSALLDADLQEWLAASPFSLPMPEPDED